MFTDAHNTRNEMILTSALPTDGCGSFTFLVDQSKFHSHTSFLYLQIVRNFNQNTFYFTSLCSSVISDKDTKSPNSETIRKF